MQKPSRRVLVGETPEEEAARFWARDRRPFPDTIRAWQTEAGLEQRTFIPLSERVVAEGIAKKVMKKS